jgi:hypothetical protein
MPQVPQVLPSVQPQSGGGGGFFNIQDPTMAFGYGAGKAQEGLGQTIEKTGDMLEKHANVLQDRANQAAATDMFVEWDKEAAGLQMWHRQQEGSNAVNTLPELYRKQDELREKYTSTAPNIEVRRLFDQDSKRRLGFMIQDAGSYAANQNKQSNIRAAKARTTLAIQGAGNSQSDEEFNFNVDQAIKGVDAQQMEHGWSDEETKVQRQIAVSATWQSHLDSIAMTDPFRAEKLYKENKEKIADPTTRMHIERNLIQQFNSVGTGHDENSIVNGAPFKEFPTVGGGTARGAISSVETGHIKGETAKYNAEGPVVQTGRYAGQRAIGKYQVMENNVRDWTKEVLGKEMTPDEFKKNPEAQDKVFDAKFGQLLEKYGNFQDAASAWHSGRPLAEAIKAGATDSYTKTEDYVKRASAAFGTGAGPLTTDSGPTWLSAATDRARAISAARFPNPEDDARRQNYERTLISRVRSNYDTVHTEQNAVKTENFMTVQGALNELDNKGRPKITNPSQIFSNPALNEAFNKLDEVKKKQILGQIEKNAKADVPLNDERLARFNEIMGMQHSNPDEFMNVVPGDEDIPFSLKKQIYTAQRGVQQNKVMDPGFQRALNNVHGMLNDADIGASMSDKSKNSRYNQFVGAFQTAREQWMKDNGGKVPSREDNSKIAAGLLTDVERPGRFFGTNTTPAFEVPAFEEAKIIEAYKTKLGTRPTPKQIYDAYQRKVGNGG